MHIGLYAGSEHAPVYTDAQLQRGTPAIYMVLLISYFSTFNLQTATRLSVNHAHPSAAVQPELGKCPSFTDVLYSLVLARVVAAARARRSPSPAPRRPCEGLGRGGRAGRPWAAWPAAPAAQCPSSPASSCRCPRSQCFRQSWAGQMRDLWGVCV